MKHKERNSWKITLERERVKKAEKVYDIESEYNFQ